MLRAFTWNQHENNFNPRNRPAMWSQGSARMAKGAMIGLKLKPGRTMKVTVFNGYPERFGKYKLAILGWGNRSLYFESCWDLFLVTSNAWVLWGWASAVPCYIEASTRQGEHLSWHAKLAKLVQHVEVTRAPCFTIIRFAVCRLRMLASLDNPTSCQGKELRFRKGHPQPAA